MERWNFSSERIKKRVESKEIDLQILGLGEASLLPTGC
jgi:hypothetical protein